MKKFAFYFLSFVLFAPLLVVAQNGHDTIALNLGKKLKKHQFYFYWGYNRSAYTTSNITMHGAGYEYTIDRVIANDKPYGFEPKIYFNPKTFSIPQYNLRLGYQLNEKWWISLGEDHMKYVVQEGQTVAMSGFIDSTASSTYAGNYNNYQQKITEDFLHFEHTDGLNLISIELEYVSNIWRSKNMKFNFEHRAGAGIGVLYPRTDVTIFGVKNPNIFNFAGYGINLTSQLRLSLWRYFFIEMCGKGGFIHMPHITTSGVKGDYAKQMFGFVEGFGVVGVNFAF